MKWLSVVCLSVTLIAGCQENVSPRLNSPPQGQSASRSSMQAPFETMVKNAELMDMAVADCDFAGTSSELSGSGRMRMHRMVEILKTYGGELRYTTDVEDQKLVQSRINRLEEYLASAGVDMNKVSVRSGMPASANMSAADAIKAQKAPTAPPDAGQGSSRPMAGLAPSGQGSGNGGDATK